MRPVVTSNPQRVRHIVEQAERKWQERDRKEAVFEAIRLWEEAVERDPNNSEALTRLARAYSFLVDAHLDNQIPPPQNLDALRLEYHQRGADAGERALVSLEPEFERTMRESKDFVAAMNHIRRDSVDAAYWYCVHLGSFAVAKGRGAQLFYKDRVAEAMHRIRELDSHFFYGAADRYLGLFYAALSGVAGKDLERSEQHFRAAQAIGPHYLGNYVLEAEFLAVQRGDRQRYVELLRAVLHASESDDPNMAPENRAAQHRARRLLTPWEIDARF